MNNLNLEDKQILFEEFQINKTIFYEFKKENQNKLFDVLLLLHDYHDFSNEFQNNDWDAEKIRFGFKLLRKTKRKINQYQNINCEITSDLDHFEEYVISEIEELDDLHHEVIINNSQFQHNDGESEFSFFDEVGELVGSFFSTLKWYVLVMFILIIGFLIVAPTHIYPMFGNCYEGESFGNCYLRIQFEKTLLSEFTLCQDGCGKGFGNEVCLEKCEYVYGKNKWTYVSE